MSSDDLCLQGVFKLMLPRHDTQTTLRKRKTSRSSQTRRSGGGIGEDLEEIFTKTWQIALASFSCLRSTNAGVKVGKIGRKKKMLDDSPPGAVLIRFVIPSGALVRTFRASRDSDGTLKGAEARGNEFKDETFLVWYIFMAFVLIILLRSLSPSGPSFTGSFSRASFPWWISPSPLGGFVVRIIFAFPPF